MNAGNSQKLQNLFDQVGKGGGALDVDGKPSEDGDAFVVSLSDLDDDVVGMLESELQAVVQEMKLRAVAAENKNIVMPDDPGAKPTLDVELYQKNGVWLYRLGARWDR